MLRIIALVIGLLIIIGGGTFFYIKKSGKGQSTATNLSDCSSPDTILKQSPVAEKDLTTIIPLGNLAPPGHVLPTTHMYYNYQHVGTGSNKHSVRTELYVPADMTVTRIMKMDNADLPAPYDSYKIDFSICKEVTGYFILVQELNEKLAAAMQPPYDQTQESDTGNGRKSHNWFKSVNVKLMAGEILGYAGGEVGYPDGLDLAIIDERTPAPKLANPDRWPKTTQHFACTLDYYEPALSQRLYQKLGNYHYEYIQPGDPACGTVYQDEPGTAKGVWIAKDAAGGGLWEVDTLAALVESNFDHSQQAFSFGGKARGIGLDVSRPLLFIPAATGSVNVDFAAVKPGQVYCYNVNNGTGQSTSKATILIELTADNTLRVGSQTTACGTGPWMFTKYLEYVR